MSDSTDMSPRTVTVTTRDAEADGLDPAATVRQLPWFDDPDDCPGNEAMCRACYWQWATDHAVTLPDGWELDAVGEPRLTIRAATPAR